MLFHLSSLHRAVFARKKLRCPGTTTRLYSLVTLNAAKKKVQTRAVGGLRTMASSEFYKHGLVSLSASKDWLNRTSERLQSTRAKLVSRQAKRLSGKQFLACEKSKSAHAAGHKPQGTMEQTLRRLGSIEIVEPPGPSNFVKPYSIMYEMVIDLHGGIVCISFPS